LKNNEIHPTVVDLFCGCGGLSVGFRDAGFKILAGVDIDKPALTTFKRNFPDTLALEADVTTLDPEDFRNHLNLKPGELDCLIGGPPCQGFSKNVPAKNRFLEDPRNALVVRFLDFVRALRPKSVIMENVAEMRNAFNGTYTEIIQELFSSLGYESEVVTIVAADYGVPQMRRRVFFTASQLGKGIPKPNRTHKNPNEEPDLFTSNLLPYVTVKEAISDLPSLKAGQGESPQEYRNGFDSNYQKLMRRNSELLFNHVARALTPIQLDRCRSLKEGEDARHLPDNLKPKSHYSGAYGRLSWSKPAPTITRWVFHPGSGRFFHPTDDRVITIREAARLQSFPDTFVFEGTYIQQSHQVGNAVPPLVAQAFARSVRQALGE